MFLIRLPPSMREAVGARNHRTAMAMETQATPSPWCHPRQQPLSCNVFDLPAAFHAEGGRHRKPQESHGYS